MSAKKVIAVISFLFLLSAGFAACNDSSPDIPEPPAPAPVISYTTTPPDGGVTLPGQAFPDSAYQLPPAPDRYYANTTHELIPSKEYGRIWPYIGGYSGSMYYGTANEHIGICDEKGKIICDPMFNEVHIIGNEKNSLYAFIKKEWYYEDPEAHPDDYWYMYKEIHNTTLSTLDGSRAQTYKRAFWKERSSYEYGAYSDYWGFSRSFVWRDALEYDYITAWQNGRWGVLDWDGSVLLPFKYREPVCFSEGLAAVLSENGKTIDFINIKGETILGPYEAPPRVVDSWQDYTDEGIPVTDKIIFHDGFAKFYENGKYGIIDKTGRVVVTPSYSFISSMNAGLAMFAIQDEDYGNNQEKGIYGIVNDTGKVILEATEFEFWANPYMVKGEAILPGYSGGNERKIAYDGTITPYEGSEPYTYSGDSYIFKNTGAILPVSTHEIHTVNDDLLLIFDRELYSPETWRLYDYNLNPVSPERPGLWVNLPYDGSKIEYLLISMTPPWGGYSGGWQTAYHQIYDLKGNQLLTGAYDTIIPIGDKYMVRGKSTAGLVDKNGNYIIEVPILANKID